MFLDWSAYETEKPCNEGKGKLSVHYFFFVSDTTEWSLILYHYCIRCDPTV